MPSPAWKFLLRTLLYLLFSMAFWYWMRETMVWLPANLSGELLATLFPSWSNGYVLHGTQLQLLTTIVSDSGPLSFRIDVLKFCYGLPLLAALLFASRARGLWWKLPAGVLSLLPLQIWGTCFYLLLVVSDAGQAAFLRTGFTQLNLNAFVIAYQLGYLLLPSLGPVLVWLCFERSFVTRFVQEISLSPN